MATILSFLSGRQITNDSGVPQAGAKIYHYRANTTTALTVWQDADASVAHAQPVVCDAGGFVPLIYVDDTFDWKVEIDTSADVSLPQYSFDDLPAAEADAGAVGFAPPLLAWEQVTSSASPVALTANDAGKAYEAGTTGGSIEFDLPDAASVGNGKGFWFKKTAAANTLTLDPNGTQTIDDSSTALAITAKDTVIGIFSNGAEWYTAAGYGLLRIINNLPEDTTPDRAADYLVTYDTSAGVEKKVLPNSLIVPGTLVAIIEDQKTSGTAPATITSGGDRTRELNILVYNRNSIASLSSNQFTLPAGAWEIFWEAPMVSNARHQTMLYDVTGAATLKRGTSQYANTPVTNGADIGVSSGLFVVTPSSSNTYEIRHVTDASSAGGTATSLGTETYTRVAIRAA